MMILRWVYIVMSGKEMTPPFGSFAKELTAALISAGSCAGVGNNSMDNDGAATFSDGKYAALGAVSGLKRIMTRRTLGAKSLSISSHFPLIDGSKLANPVIFPPGREKLETNPLPTGSATFVNTVGMLRVSRRMAATPGLVLTKMRSGFRATISLAFAAARSAVDVPNRYMSCTFT